MGRMHTHRHGKSHSIRPATLRAPSWITLTPAEIEALVVKYAKDGLTSKSNWNQIKRSTFNSINQTNYKKKYWSNSRRK